MDSGQAGDTGAAENMSQHGFRLVVHGVRGDDYVHGSLFGQSPEKFVARASRRVFQIGLFAPRSARHVATPNMEGKGEFFRQRGDKFFVASETFPRS